MSTNLLESPAAGMSRWNPKVACALALVLVFLCGAVLGAVTMDQIVHNRQRTPVFETAAGKALYFDRLRKELILRAELEAAAHKQGFGSLDEVDRAVLDPGGSISFTAKKPGPDESRHTELLKKLEDLSRQIATLRTALNPPAV